MKKLWILIFLFAVIGVWYRLGMQRSEPKLTGATNEENASKSESKESVNTPQLNQADAQTSSLKTPGLEEKLSTQIPSNLKGRLQFQIQVTSKNRAKVYWRLDGKSVRRADTLWIFDEQKGEWMDTHKVNWGELKIDADLKTPSASAVESAIKKELESSEVSGTITKIGTLEWDLIQRKKLKAFVPVYVEINRNGLSPLLETWEVSVPSLKIEQKFPNGKHQSPRDAHLRARSDEP